VNNGPSTAQDAVLSSTASPLGFNTSVGGGDSVDFACTFATAGGAIARRLSAPVGREGADSAEAALCPGRGASGRVHGYQWRTLADVPVDGRRVAVRVRVRRLVCPLRGYRHTFREQVPGGAGASSATHHPPDCAGLSDSQKVTGPGGGTRAGGTRGRSVASHGAVRPAAQRFAHRADASARRVVCSFS
jgi:hypothetical protein